MNQDTARTSARPGAGRALFAAIVGTVIEWYDYALYGTAAGLVIGPLFFPKSLPATQQLLAFATFAVGFVVRPLGGFVISHLGDRFGRKPAMVVTVVMMGAATVGMGLLPTAASVGIWAPVLLVVLTVCMRKWPVSLVRHRGWQVKPAMPVGASARQWPRALPTALMQIRGW